MAKKTIIYLTDNTLDEEIAKLCRDELLSAAGGKPIISVSQKPLDFGKNVCVGEIGRSWMSLYQQELVGLKVAETEFVAIAEHDCLYTPEHFNWTPPDKRFWYNGNCWFVQWGGTHPELNGMYSKWHHGRLALSQLICTRTELLKLIEQRIALIEAGLKDVQRFGEAGSSQPKAVKLAEIAISGKSAYIKELFKENLKYRAKIFKTKMPNLDIRHATNFTGPRRGGYRRYELPYWGKFKWIT